MVEVVNTDAINGYVDFTIFEDCIIRNNSVENYISSSTNIRCVLYGLLRMEQYLFY